MTRTKWAWALIISTFLALPAGGREVNVNELSVDSETKNLLQTFIGSYVPQSTVEGEDSNWATIEITSDSANSATLSMLLLEDNNEPETLFNLKIEQLKSEEKSSERKGMFERVHDIKNFEAGRGRIYSSRMVLTESLKKGDHKTYEISELRIEDDVLIHRYVKRELKMKYRKWGDWVEASDPIEHTTRFQKVSESILSQFPTKEVQQLQSDLKEELKKAEELNESYKKCDQELEPAA